MRILVLGASGYVGRRVKRVLSECYQTVYGTYGTECSQYDSDSSMYRYRLGDSGALEMLLEQTEPEYIVSCLRGDFEEQLEAHRTAAAYLAAHSGKLIFLSTANVFDAAMECGHFEGDTPKSDSDYGNYKIKCEKELQNLLGDGAVIIRIPGVWGRECPRLLRLVEDIRHGAAVVTYKNLFINLTTDVQIADWILYIIQHDLRGIFHVGTKDTCEYLTFHRDLIADLHLEGAVFDVNDYGEPRIWQAVLPGRREIPESMQLSIKAVIKELASSLISSHNDY